MLISSHFFDRLSQTDAEYPNYLEELFLPHTFAPGNVEQ
jgi:hypothetical protein